jgi:hypothetical protein
MIVFNLMCKDCSSEFEGWFSNSKSCDTQIKKKLVECVICNSSNIEKTLSKPNVSVNKGKDKSSEKVLRELKNKIKDVKKFIEKNCDYVGDNFAYEARKIHYGKKDKKPIYGKATKEDVVELNDEGIEVASIPWVEEEN